MLYTPVKAVWIPSRIERVALDQIVIYCTQIQPLVGNSTPAMLKAIDTQPSLDPIEFSVPTSSLSAIFCRIITSDAFSVITESTIPANSQFILSPGHSDWRDKAGNQCAGGMLSIPPL